MNRMRQVQTFGSNLHMTDNTDLLRTLARLDGSSRGLAPIADRMGMSASAVSSRIKQAEKDGLVQVDRGTKPMQIILDEPGKDILLFQTSGPKQVQTPDELIRLHRPRFAVELHEDVTDHHAESVLKSYGNSYTYRPNRGHVAYRDGSKVRITPERLYIHLKEIYARTPDEAKDRAMHKVLEHVEALQDVLPVRRDISSAHITVREQHIAHEDDPLADLVAMMCEANQDLRPQDFTVETDRGEEYFIDGSKGWELESALTNHAEDNMRRWQQFLAGLVLHDIGPEHLELLDELLEDNRFTDPPRQREAENGKKGDVNGGNSETPTLSDQDVPKNDHPPTVSASADRDEPDLRSVTGWGWTY